MNQLPEIPRYNDESQWNKWRGLDVPPAEQPTVAHVYQFPLAQARTVIAMVESEQYASGHDYPGDMPFTD